MEADQDGDGKLNFEEFAQTVANTVRFVFKFFVRISHTELPMLGYRQTNDTRGSILRN